MNIDRIKRDIEELNKLNSTPEKGCTRFSYSEEDKKARSYLIGEMEKLGLDINIDAIGNIRARLNGANNESQPILVGSHIDTVVNGGKFDGILGVVVGLEALRHIVERKINHINPIELIVFVEEEGCNFGTPMVGSKTLTGIFNIEDLKRFKNDKGISVYDAAKKFGLKPDNIRKDVLKPNEIKAMIELHIEQSLVLEKNEISVGVIEKIAGVRRLEIEFEGVSNHAGATPMNLRYDPMTAASKVIASIDKIVEEKAFKTTVATVGKINCYPNAINVIPEKVIFTVDIRDINSHGIDIVENEIRSTIKYISNYYEIKSKIKITGEAPHINLSPKIISILQSSAKDQNIEYLNMNSGAAHDACILSTITNAGMLFVPSINGRSHAPEENTSYDDIEKGAKVLLGALVRLSN